jgi:succinoglycan biosynthesis protein ExoM
MRRRETANRNTVAARTASDPLSQELTNLLTVVIPSIGRPSLRSAIESCLGQDLLPKEKMEVVVVDNTLTGDLRGMIDHYAKRDPRVRYVHQPCKGFSHARNAGVEQALGTYVAFLDDDEEASVGWAPALLRQAHQGAFAVFGPIRASFDAPLDCPEAESLFSRSLAYRDGSDITRHHAYLGTGNSLFRRDVCFPSRPFFATEFNDLGGEDSDFLMGLVDCGIRLIWASDALVVEHVPSERIAPVRMALHRFRSGQIRSQVCFRSGRLRTLQGIILMAAGIIQVVLCGLLSITCQPFDHKTALRFRLKAAGGLGKVLWMKPFRPVLSANR